MNAETSLSITYDVNAEEDTEAVVERLDAIVEGLGLDLSEIEMTQPGLFSCLDCGCVVSTSSRLKLDHKAEPKARRYDDEEFEKIKDQVVTLSETCPGWGCSANAFERLEFGVVVDLG